LWAESDFSEVAEVLAHVADVFVFSLSSEDVVAYRVFRNLFRLGIRISSVCVIIFCGFFE
jgi:DNA-binding MurR/RpiR family transcriptional regulator